jgi:hypothetical protein
MPNLYYRISDPNDVRDLAEQMAAWELADNPKRFDWSIQPAAPSDNAMWADGAWIVPPAPTFTATEWVDAQQFSGNRTTTMLYLKLRLDAAGKTSPKLAAVQAWLDGMIVAGVTQPDMKRSDWDASPWSFEEASSQALQILMEGETPNPET